MTRPGLSLGTYMAASHAIALVAPSLLRSRLRKGRELPDRWREKLGEPGLPRPEGPLIWLHAVGLGETLALRGLVGALARQAPDCRFLITSTTRSSAEVLARNLPERTIHQFLPLDAPGYLARFLDHWKPALSVWAEQDLWPGAVVAADRRGIPLVLVNARMNADALARRRRWRGLYADLFARFRLITAQDADSARHLETLGAQGVRVSGSLKAGGPALSADQQALAEVRAALAGRRAVLLASSHHEDEFAVFSALRSRLPGSLLIVAPRDPARGTEVAARAMEHGLSATRRGAGQGPGGDVWIADTFGEMGLWYRLCPVTLVGGTFGAVQGHNPWEPAALGSAVLHGPRIANFADDFDALHAAGAALPVQPEELWSALALDYPEMAARASALSEVARGALDPLAAELLDLAGLA